MIGVSGTAEFGFRSNRTRGLDKHLIQKAGRWQRATPLSAACLVHEPFNIFGE
jgi:hypothetical protein